MISLNQQKAKLVNVNPRAELHGDEYKVACDLQLEIKVSNDVLSEFDPTLKSSLYRVAEESDGGQQDLLAGHQPGHMPKLRYPLMGKIAWGWEGAGYATTVHYGVSGKADILMIDNEVDKFRFDCQDGGTVIVTFRVIAHPGPEELGRLCEMIQQEVSITLQPPTAEEQFQMKLKKAQGEGDGE